MGLDLLEYSKLIVIGHRGLIGASIHKGLRASYPQLELLGISRQECDLAQERAVDYLAQYFDPGCLLIFCAARHKGSTSDNQLFNLNLLMTQNLIKAIEKKPIAKLVLLSSAGVYGEDVLHAAPINELTTVEPSSYYAVSKYASERLLQIALANLGIPLLILRPSIVYGFADRLSYTPSGFLQTLRRNEVIPLWGDGSELRDFIYVEDLCLITLRLLQSGYCGILNAVAGQSRSYMDALNIAFQLLGRKAQLQHRQRTKNKVDIVFNNSKLFELIPDFSFSSLELGMQKTYAQLMAAQSLSPK